MPNNSHFAVAPSDVNKNRSTFDIPHRHLSTGNFGEIIPFLCMEVMPGDTFDVNTRLFSRMSTPLYPVMDDAFINYYYFFVPSRLVWSKWPEFLGENKYSAWANEVEYIIPHASVVPEIGSVYDHMGIPTYSEDIAEEIGFSSRPSLDLNFLPLRAYHLIYNEWFRNENTTDPILVNTGDNVSAEEIAGYQTLCKASKPFDAFTSALPAPQKGDAVDIPLLGSAVVKTSEDPLLDDNAIGLIYGNPGGFGQGYTFVQGTKFEYFNLPGGSVGVRGKSLDWTSTPSGFNSSEDQGGPINLYADLSTASAATINQLRQAFQMQRLLELQARSGSRYTEIIKASFGVTSPDARLQRPEYLGGSKVRIQMQQVTQQSASSSESPLGKVGAYSKTVAASRDFNHSFTEHGYLIGVAVARHSLTYQQGLNKMWSRRGRFDFYWPTFANIGEQPIYQRELFATGNETEDSKVFGYQEAWYEYRYNPNILSGMFRSTVDGNLDEWHYGDFYSSAPILSDGWMQASSVNVDRTLAVSSALHDQLLFDFAVDLKATRVMPLYSIPGQVERF